MDLIGKKVRNTEGNIGIVQSLSIDDNKIVVFFDAYNETRNYEFVLALKYSLTFLDVEAQAAAERLVEQVRKISEKKFSSDIDKTKRKNINGGTGEHNQDNYYYSYNKSAKGEGKNSSLSLSFNSLKRTIKNASYDLKQTELASRAPDNKKDYYPDNYDERWDQACYILRYSYAYAFEYYQLYAKILGKNYKSGNIKVLSLGCGAMIDAWSLEAAYKTRGELVSIEYTGVDKAIRWANDYQPETPLITKNKAIFNTCAGSFLMSCSSLDYDIIVFPKSLRDIYCNDYADFLRIGRAFETKNFNNRICIAFSLINNPESMDNEKHLSRDMEMIEELISCLKKQGYTLSGAPMHNIKSTDAVYYKSGYPEMDERLKDDSENLTGKKMMTTRKYQRYTAYILERE